MQGDDLDRLAEAHIVGEAAAKPKLAHACQPGQSPELVGPQHGHETGWLGQRLEPASRQHTETVGHLGYGAFGHDLDDLAVDFELAAEKRRERCSCRDPPRAPLLCLGDELGFDSDKAAPDPHEASLCLREEVNLLRAERLPADGELVVEFEQ